MYKIWSLLPTSFGLMNLTCFKEINYMEAIFGHLYDICSVHSSTFSMPLLFWTNLRTYIYIFNLFAEHRMFLLVLCSNSNWLFSKGSTFPAAPLSKDLSFSCTSVICKWESGRRATHSLFWPFYPRNFRFSLKDLFILIL